jgi:anti-sigma regulatory factor (Ser/Thr protein kinase)
LIFDELVNNSIEHGCRSPDDEVAVESRVTFEAVELRVIDPGEGVLSAESFPSTPNGVFTETGRGAGLLLVRTFTDEIRVEEAVSGGTLITAVKYRVGKAT